MPISAIARRTTLAALLLMSLLGSGCAVIAVTGAAVSVASTVVSTGVKVTGAVIKGGVDLVTDDDEDEDD